MFRMDLEQNGCKDEVQLGEGGGALVSTTINSTKARKCRKFLDISDYHFILRTHLLNWLSVESTFLNLNYLPLPFTMPVTFLC
jgi:hypothetical protein